MKLGLKIDYIRLFLAPSPSFTSPTVGLKREAFIKCFYMLTMQLICSQQPIERTDEVEMGNK